MADMYAVAGARFYIGGVLATKSTDFSSSDFSGQSWVEVDGWAEVGSFGDTAALIASQLVNRLRDIKMKGSLNAGQMQNKFNFKTGDAGQVAMLAAKNAQDNYAFKIVWDDIPSGGSTGTVHYFIGLVMGWAHAGGGPNTARTVNSTIEINSNIVEVAAA